jgi:paraquat-inducible protein B
VVVGEVTGLELTRDNGSVVVHATLGRDFGPLAREGTTFWIVRPEVGFQAVRGLATVISGPYIEMVPGSGKPKHDFVGLDDPDPALGRAGLHVTLVRAQLASVRPRTSVTYRGIEVGMVVATRLSRDATTAQVEVLIEQPHARLVRVGSRFWSTGGIDVSASLFKGVEINIESLRSLVAGGIAFATPEGESAPARAHTIFVLHEKPEPAWLTWAPKISLPAARN